MTKNIDSLTDPSQLLELAEELEDNDQLTEALQAVEKAIKLDPQNGKAWCSKASILQDMDQPGEAFRVLTQACKDLPNNLDCLFNLGAFLSEHGNVSQACGCFDKINKLDPNYPKIKVHLGNAFLKLALWPQAIECLGEALQTELGPMDKARVLNHIGEAHMNNLDPEKPEENKRELEKAKEYFDHSLELNPDDYIPVGNMAMTFCRLGEPEAALKVLEPALAKFPTQARLYVMQGITLSLIEGRQKEALAAFDKAIELAPDNPDLWFHKAHYYVRRQDFGQAAEIFEEGLRKHPESGELHLQYGSLLRHMQRIPESVQHHRQGLKLLGRLVHWGFFFVDENNKPVEGTNIAIESDRLIPREKIAEQYFKQLQAQGHTVDKDGKVDGKYRVGMTEVPEERLTYSENLRELK